jgi:hypothetical protein
MHSQRTPLAHRLGHALDLFTHLGEEEKVSGGKGEKEKVSGSFLGQKRILTPFLFDTFSPGGSQGWPLTSWRSGWRS